MANKDFEILQRKAIPFIDLIRGGLTSTETSKMDDLRDIYLEAVSAETILEYFDGCTKGIGGTVKLHGGDRIRLLGGGKVLIGENEHHVRNINDFIEAIRKERGYLLWKPEPFQDIMLPFHNSFLFSLDNDSKTVFSYDDYEAFLKDKNSKAKELFSSTARNLDEEDEEFSVDMDSEGGLFTKGAREKRRENKRFSKLFDGLFN